uniref:CUB domain-containing protein n=1 Tax=Macrostomum lignano TaxID=282301 RepID=A0A1I8G210_9PLAT
RKTTLAAWLRCLCLVDLSAKVRQSNCLGGLQRLSAEAGGEIASHSGVGTTNYSSNSQCYWQLDVPPGKRVIVWFTYMDLESPNDRVTLYDGLTTSSEIAVVSATDSVGYESPKFVSSANILTVNFYSNSQYVRKGFRLEYKATVSANSSACGPVTFDDASNSSGMIVSHPGYDQHSLYSASMSCSWTLPSVSGKFYQLYVGNVSLGNGDCLSVYQGTASVTGGSSNVNLCGWKAVTGMALQVDGNFIIRFSSNGAYESTGFQIKFELVNYCPDNRNLTNSTGEVVSHSGVGEYYYWNNAQCVWYITAPPGQQVWFWFSYFNLGYNDYVSARNMGESSSTISTLSRGYSPSPSGFQSATRAVSVTFTTNSRDSGLGFRLHYNFTQLYCYGFENVTATKTGSQIRSHYGVGSRYYLNNMSCYWHIRVPVGQRIAFRFTYFNTRTNDRVTVFDGSNGSAVLLSTSGSFNGAIISSANTATVWFNTDSVNRGYGFAVWLQEIDNTANNTCGTISYANSSNVSGVIESHKGYNATSMSAYAPNLACLWTLPKRPGFYIYLFIETYGIGMGDCLKMVTKFFSTAICQGTELLTNDTGELASHSSAGIMGFLINSDCYWVIRVSPSKRVVARFTFFNITSRYESVTLYDGAYGSTVLATLSSSFSDTTRDFITTENVLTFKDDMLCKFTSVCEKYKLITGGSGEISSHQDAGALPYISGVSCKWQFVGKPGIQISANLIYLNLTSNYDSIAFYKGSDDITLVTIRGGASTWPKKFVTLSNILTVVFITGNVAGNNTNGLGFRLQYSVGDSVEPATTSSKQTSSSTARAVVSSPSSPATTKIVSDTSFAPESTTTGKLSQ